MHRLTSIITSLAGVLTKGPMAGAHTIHRHVITGGDDGHDHLASQ